MRILALLTDAFGGHGGIALYNRDFLTAACNDVRTGSVTAVARHAPRPLESLPEKLDYSVARERTVGSYLSTVVARVRSGRPFDLVLCGHINLMPVAWLIARWQRSPILLETYGIEAWQPTSRNLTNRLVGKANLVTCISRLTRDRLKSWVDLADDRFLLVPNAVHMESIGIARPQPRFVDRLSLAGRKVILTFGRMVSRDRAKGFDEVLDLMPELVRRVPDIVYVLAGDGPDRQRLQDKARALGLDGSAVFTGPVDEGDKDDLYHAADVFVMPSRGEGFGFVLLEAMARGVPTIASCRDGGQEAAGYGELAQVIDPDDPDATLAAILAALEMPKRVPPGLERFSFENFSRNVSTALGKAAASA